MKTSLHFFIVALVIFTRVSSQALYKTADDFVAGKASYAGKHTRIKLHQLFRRNTLEIKHNDSVYTYFKKDVYGFVDKDGNTSRFFNTEIYPILNPSERILIYKKTSGTGMKNSPIVDSYFFSINASSQIMPLTIRNLELACLGNPEFNKIIELYFRSDRELTEYDNIHKMYKLNRLLELAKTI